MILINNIQNFKEKFFQGNNELFKADISVSAKWLYVYLTNRPDGWIVRNTDLMNVLNCKIEKLQKAKEELIELGLLKIKRFRLTTGTFDYEMTVVGFSDSGKLSNCNINNKISTTCFTANGSTVNGQSDTIVKQTIVKQKNNKTDNNELCAGLQEVQSLESEREQLRSWIDIGGNWFMENWEEPTSLYSRAMEKFDTISGLEDLKVDFLFEVRKWLDKEELKKKTAKAAVSIVSV